MTITEQVARAHAAFDTVARAEGLTPFDIRLLFAVAELGGDPTTLTLEETLRVHGSAVRRSLLSLYALHVTGVGADGGRRRRGIRTRVYLTPRGLSAVRQVGEILGVRVTLEVAA